LLILMRYGKIYVGCQKADKNTHTSMAAKRCRICFRLYCVNDVVEKTEGGHKNVCYFYQAVA